MAKVIVIGGGPAGIMAAITAAKNNTSFIIGFIISIPTFLLSIIYNNISILSYYFLIHFKYKSGWRHASAKKATFVSQPKGSKRKISPYKNLINLFFFYGSFGAL